MELLTKSFVARPHKTGPDRSVRLQDICCYLEGAAEEHADMLGCGSAELTALNQAWVLAKMRVLLHAPFYVGDSVTLRTWPSAIERLQFRRDFTLHDSTGGLLVSAMTSWIVINLASRKIERTPSWAVNLTNSITEKAVEDGQIKIPAVQGVQPQNIFPIRMGDIDQNNHINNVCYCEFAHEAAEKIREQGGYMPTPLRRLDVLFRAEGFMGDTVQVVTQEESPTNSWLHCLLSQNTGQELARVRTVYL